MIAVPRRIRVEASTACQLACPTCPTAEGKTAKVLGRKYLTAADFRRLLDQGAGAIREVELSNFGEPFLNPHLVDIFRIAYESGVAVNINNGANLNHVRADALEGLVEYGVRTLRCSIDGASEATYARYRRKGSFAAVLQNIKAINAHKARYKSPLPELIWQFVVFGHNQHELEAARIAARVLDMRFVTKLPWDDTISPVTDRERLRRDLGHATTRDDYLAETGKVYFGEVCHQIWTQPQVNSDGLMLGCCNNYWLDFGGNAFDDLPAAFNSPAMVHARGMLKGEAPPRDSVACSTCHVYETRRRTGRWVKEEDFATDRRGFE